MEARRWSGKHAPCAGDELHASKACRVETVLLPRSQNAAWTERQALSCRPTTRVPYRREIEQAESLVVPLHEFSLRHADAPAS